MSVINDYDSIAALYRSIAEEILKRSDALDPYNSPLGPFDGEIRVVLSNDPSADLARGGLTSSGVRAIEQAGKLDRDQLLPYTLRAGKEVRMSSAAFCHNPLKQ
jgi:hypothetical protein